MNITSSIRIWDRMFIRCFNVWRLIFRLDQNAITLQTRKLCSIHDDGGLEAAAKHRSACVLVLLFCARTTQCLSAASSSMSNFSDKATQKAKKKVGRVADRPRPSSRRESRAASPLPSQQHERSNTPAPVVDPHSVAGMTNEQVCVCDKTRTPTQLTHRMIGKRHEDNKTR